MIEMPTDEEILQSVREILDGQIDIPACVFVPILRERLKQARADELARIIKIAEVFWCCPFCGNTKLDSHWCPKCKKPFAVPDDAYRFAMHLKKETK